MKKAVSVLLALMLCIGLFAGCQAQNKNAEGNAKVISPLPETLDIHTLDNCTVAVSLEKGDVSTDANGKLQMQVKVYAYELYDMVDIASLEENDVIVRQNKEITVTALERLDSGIVRINGGEENGGFDLASDDTTVYYEVGMSDVKAYYELGEVTLPVADAFEYIDASELDAKEQHYTAEALAKADMDYHFVPHNTSIVIENGVVTKMNRVYMP